MHRGNRRLQLVRADSTHAQRFFHQLQPFFNLRTMPGGAVLLLERHQLPSGIDASVSSRIVQQHQREQAEIFGFVRHQLAKHPRQANGFHAELTTH
jgi:hypothetical protein